MIRERFLAIVFLRKTYISYFILHYLAFPLFFSKKFASFPRPCKKFLVKIVKKRDKMGPIECTPELLAVHESDKIIKFLKIFFFYHRQAKNRQRSDKIFFPIRRHSSIGFWWKTLREVEIDSSPPCCRNKRKRNNLCFRRDDFESARLQDRSFHIA